MKISITGTNTIKQKGFTLIEVVFVLALFLIIIGVTISIFLSIVRHQKRILVEQELLNQGSYAFEYMSKALRMAVKDNDGSCLGGSGKIYLLTHCLNGTLDACQGIKFINQSDGNACQEFFLDDTTDPANPALSEIKNASSAQHLLSDAFEIKHAKFIINGDQTLHEIGGQDASQPRVTVLLDLKTKDINDPQEKIIQTTVSIRNLNIP
ncbi:prepilin-type N-terminal cleavage/methylation domain-containing protein [Candidatus Parcubacteria bacterium]|nr:prepilin-type N-terminal cleavage/methylation domain-containing protein [Candidatus Parcubacteria bacterium]